MANKDAAFGFKPTRHLTGGLIRTEEYAIARRLLEHLVVSNKLVYQQILTIVIQVQQMRMHMLYSILVNMYLN
jgi:hypothetical protein